MDDDHDHDDLYARFEGGYGRRDQEIESDANWVPSYAAEVRTEVEEEEAADDVINARRRIGKGKEIVYEAQEFQDVAVSYDEYEQTDNMESDGDYRPSGDDFEGTIQYAQKRTREEKGKKKRKSDNVEGELETSGRTVKKKRKSDNVEGKFETSGRIVKRKRKSDNVEGKLETSGRLVKRKRKSDNVERELETSGRFVKNALKNNSPFQVHEVDSNKKSGTAGETKSTGRKRRKTRKERKDNENNVDNVDNVEGEDARWVRSLQGPQLRLMEALKELGTVRVNTIKVDSLYNCLTPEALRVIGIILEEHVKEKWSLLGSEAPVQGEEKVQKGDLSSGDAQLSADNVCGVDDVDDMKRDQKAETHPQVVLKK